MNQISIIACLLVITSLAHALDSYPVFPNLPIEEANKRSQQVMVTWAKSPILGDDISFDTLIAKFETDIIRQRKLLFDELGLLGTNALVSLEREILHIGLKDSEDEIPDPTKVQPNKLATHGIMATRPYCVGAMAAANDGDPIVRMISIGLMNAGEAHLALNFAGAMASALASAKDGGFSLSADELRLRSAHLRFALANGYRLPGLSVVETPFDNVLASWCLLPRPPGELDLYKQASATYERHIAERAINTSVERAWNDVMGTYQIIHGTSGVAIVGWKQVMASVVLPVLVREMIVGIDEFSKPNLSSESGIPLPGAESGSVISEKYMAWLRTGGPYVHSAAEISKNAGGATEPRMRLIGAVWLVDRLLEEVPEDRAANSLRLPFDYKVFSGQLDPLRRLSSIIGNMGPTDSQLESLKLELMNTLVDLNKNEELVTSRILQWHSQIDAIPSLDGWNITAQRTARYCKAVGVLGRALLNESQHAATRDFYRLQRDVSGMLVLYDQNLANYGPPLLYSHVRAIRLGVLSLAARTSENSRYRYGTVPEAGGRILELPDRLPFETNEQYWYRACRDVIFPSFSRNHIDRGLKEMAAVWIRSRAGSTRVASIALDRLMMSAWSVRTIMKQELNK